MKKEILIYGKEFVTKEGRKFVKYTYHAKNEEWLDVYFSRNCLMKPSTKGYWKIEFDDETDYFIKENKNPKGNKILVLMSVDSIVQSNLSEVDKKELKKQESAKYFD